MAFGQNLKSSPTETVLLFNFRNTESNVGKSALLPEAITNQNIIANNCTPDPPLFLFCFFRGKKTLLLRESVNI